MMSTSASTSDFSHFSLVTLAYFPSFLRSSILSLKWMFAIFYPTFLCILYSQVFQIIQYALMLKMEVKFYVSYSLHYMSSSWLHSSILNINSFLRSMHKLRFKSISASFMKHSLTIPPPSEPHNMGQESDIRKAIALSRFLLNFKGLRRENGYCSLSVCIQYITVRYSCRFNSQCVQTYKKTITLFLPLLMLSFPLTLSTSES